MVWCGLHVSYAGCSDWFDYGGSIVHKLVSDFISYYAGVCFDFLDFDFVCGPYDLINYAYVGMTCDRRGCLLGRDCF